MAKTISENIAEAGKQVANTAKTVGSSIAEGASKALEMAKETVGLETENRGIAGIKEHMKVFASCGKQVGVVDHVLGSAIQLTRKDSADKQHHFIPTSWVAKVDNHVHLNKNSQETERNWSSTAESCGCS